MVMPPTQLEPTRHGSSLRRALGGRLRTYRPRPAGRTRLEAIRTALLRGELVLNGFNRWRLLRANRSALGWTFVQGGETAEAARVEVLLAQREAGQLRVIVADETTAEEAITRIRSSHERPELLVARRDWVENPAPCPAFRKMLAAAREHGLVVHVIAALASATGIEDELHREARYRRQFDHEPLLRPPSRSSHSERRFGESLFAAGLDPVPQKPVAHCFLDFAIIGSSGGLPVKLDVEVDGRYWHEELPGRLRPEDERRDRIMRRLGWRPIRFWTDEIERDEPGCIARIVREAASATPLAGRNSTTEEGL